MIKQQQVTYRIEVVLAHGGNITLARTPGEAVYLLYNCHFKQKFVATKISTPTSKTPMLHSRASD